SDLGALPFGRRPQPPLSCNPLLNHADFGSPAASQRRQAIAHAGCVGDQQKQIVAGIREHYTPEQLVGKLIGGTMVPGRPGWLPTQVSGKEVTSPPPPPLRTARESFPSCSSSLSNALCRTRLSHI